MVSCDLCQESSTHSCDEATVTPASNTADETDSEDESETIPPTPQKRKMIYIPASSTVSRIYCLAFGTICMGRLGPKPKLVCLEFADKPGPYCFPHP
jgi:hypothetical protein